VPEIEFLQLGSAVTFFSYGDLLKLNRITKVEMMFCCRHFGNAVLAAGRQSTRVKRNEPIGKRGFLLIRFDLRTLIVSTLFKMISFISGFVPHPKSTTTCFCGGRTNENREP
jgi:hypothetical protein